MKTLPQYTMRELMEAGIHFGHKTMRWNPKMAKYIFGIRDNLHILDLQQTVLLLNEALTVLKTTAKKNGRILFVGTKKQASQIIADSAQKCGQYFVNHRWLGGMLTNWNTISKSIVTLKQLEEKIKFEESLGLDSTLTKKEKLELSRKYHKINRSLGGIRSMGGRPDILFVIDTNRESIAIEEAKALGIPVIGVIDTNSNPDNITYPIPGNDDASRAIKLYCNLAAEAILSGLQDSAISSKNHDIKFDNEETNITEADPLNLEAETSLKSTSENLRGENKSNLPRKNLNIPKSEKSSHSSKIEE